MTDQESVLNDVGLAVLLSPRCSCTTTPNIYYLWKSSLKFNIYICMSLENDVTNSSIEGMELLEDILTSDKMICANASINHRLLEQWLYVTK